MKRKAIHFRPKKKVKRSRGFWAQRKTAQITPCPVDSDEERSNSNNKYLDQVEEFVEEEPDDRQLLLQAFAKGQNVNVVSDESHEDSSDDEDDEDIDVDDEEEDDEDEVDTEEVEGADHIKGSRRKRSKRYLDVEKDEIENDSEANEDEEEDDEDDSEANEDNDENDEDDSQGSEDKINDNEDDVEDWEENDDDHKELDNEKASIHSEDDQDSIDPFLARCELEIASDLREAVASRSFVKEQHNWNHLGQIEVIKPNYKSSKAITTSKPVLEASGNAENFRREAKIQEAQSKLIAMSLVLPCRIDVQSNPFVKPQLKKNLNLKATWSDFEEEIFFALDSYRDLSLCNQNLSNSKGLRSAYVLHALNHLLKTRSQIVLHNEKISKQKAKRRGKKSQHVEYRDQGFCRPKVLVLVPFRETARQVISLMFELLLGVGEESKSEGRIFNRRRFEEEFGSNVDIESAKNKPDDFYELFKGNIDDAFKIGLAVTKKSLKLFTDFYSSDIIVASPLGLRMTMNKEEANDEHDFLSAIELIVLDQSDVFMMQNWDHVKAIFERLNQQPKTSHGADFARVRMWALEGHSAFYRQTVLLSSVQMAELNALARSNCSNYLGRMHNNNNVVSLGSVKHVVVPIPMVFQRLRSSSLLSSPKERLHFFLTNVLPEYKKDSMYHTCVFVPSYFDYVRVRNALKTGDADFLEICEYTKERKMAKARDKFYHSETHFIVYTERIHFYRRFTIKGIRHLIFYQLPQYPHFFAELCNFMQAVHQNKKGGSDNNMSCTIIFDQYDALRLSAVVGTDKAAAMLQSSKNTHVLMAGAHT